MQVKIRQDYKKYIVGLCGTFVLVVMVAGCTPKVDSNPVTASPDTVKTIIAPLNSNESSKLEEKKKKKAEDEAKAKIEKAKNPDWNKTDVDMMSNGNLPLAINMLGIIKDMPAGEAVPAEKVFKTPWNYYGKAISFSGTVGVVEDQPPGSDLAKSGLSSEIVISTDDGTIVDYFCMVPSGNIKIGQSVTISGYPVGRTEVDNTVGGKFTHLIVVTNKVE